MTLQNIVGNADAHEPLLNPDGLSSTTLGSRLFSVQGQGLCSMAGRSQAYVAVLEDEEVRSDDDSIHIEDSSRASTIVARGLANETPMKRSFSPLAALALGFRYESLFTPMKGIVLKRTLQS
jgi:hypothetical protein